MKKIVTYAKITHCLKLYEDEYKNCRIGRSGSYSANNNFLFFANWLAIAVHSKIFALHKNLHKMIEDEDGVKTCQFYQ